MKQQQGSSPQEGRNSQRLQDTFQSLVVEGRREDMVGSVYCSQGIGVVTVLLLRDSCYCDRKDLSRCLSRGERTSRGDVQKREGV